MRYTNAPVAGTRRGAFLLTVLMFLTVSGELAMRYVRTAPRQPLSETPAWLFLFLYTFVPIGVAVWLLARLGELEQQHSTPTPAMRKRFLVALGIGIFGYAIIFVAERLL